MSTGTPDDPGPPRFVATVAGQEYPCEAPFSAWVRLLTPEGRREVPREAVERIDQVWTTARWGSAAVHVAAASPTGWVVAGDRRSPGVPLRQVVARDALQDVQTHRSLVLRRRPRWVTPPEPDPTLVGSAVRDGDRILPTGQPFAGLVPVLDTAGERLVELTEVDRVDVATSVRVDGSRWEVAEVVGETLTLLSPERGSRRASVHDVTDVTEEVRGAPPRPRQVTERTPVVARPLLTGTGDVVAWVADAGPEHRELRDLVAAAHRTGRPELVALLEELLPRLRSADPARDDAIGWMRLDWTLRTLTPLWLDAAGLPSDEIATAAPVTGREQALALERPLRDALEAAKELVVEVRRGPRDDLESVTWRADRSGGPADALIKVASRVAVSRGVGRVTDRGALVGGVATIAANIRGPAARVVATRGVPPAVRPRLAGVVAGVADLVRAAVRP